MRSRTLLGQTALLRNSASFRETLSCFNAASLPRPCSTSSWAATRKRGNSSKLVSPTQLFAMPSHHSNPSDMISSSQQTLQRVLLRLCKVPHHRAVWSSTAQPWVSSPLSYLSLWARMTACYDQRCCAVKYSSALNKRGETSP